MKPILCFLLLGGSWALAHAESTFTLQGRLGSAGAPAEGPHDFEFRLFDAATGGTQISDDLARDTVDVTDGIFTVQLDFGDAPFNSNPRWLEIDVRESGSGAYTTLDPRQRIGASPFAIETLFVAPGAVDSAALQDGAVTTAKLAPAAVGTSALADDAVTRAKIAAGAIGTTEIENNTVASADIRDGAVTQVDLGLGAVGSAQIEDQSIAAVDLAPGSVGSDEILDGSITPADVSGGLYARKGHLYLVREQVFVTFGKAVGTVQCADANDLLLWAVCSPESVTSSLRLVTERIVNADNDVQPATLQCRMINDTPTEVEAYFATVACVAVP